MYLRNIYNHKKVIKLCIMLAKAPSKIDISVQQVITTTHLKRDREMLPKIKIFEEK